MQLHQLPEVEKYILSLPRGDREKLADFIDLLIAQRGKLESGHTKYLRDKIWELRLDFGKKQHRLLYTILPGEIIALLTAFSKKTQKTPPAIIDRSMRLRDALIEYFKEKNYEKK